MQQAPPISGDAIAACRQCRQLWFATPDNNFCQICGRQADYFLPFGVSGAAPVFDNGADVDAAPAPPSMAPYSGECPHCQGPLELVVTPDFIEVRGATSNDLPTPADGLTAALGRVEPADPPASAGVETPLDAGAPSPLEGSPDGYEEAPTA